MTHRAYRVEVSRRAQFPRLKMSAREGLVVVVPEAFDQSRIPAIVDGRRDWVQRSERRLAEQRRFLVPTPPGGRPEQVLLRVIGEDWGVDYRPTDIATVATVERPGNRLLVYGNVTDDAIVMDSLRRWLARQTRRHVVPWLSRLAAENACEVTNIVVRSQRTRWASCSPLGTISLNLRLMLIPEPLVRYAMLHELAHTTEMNHGPRFWAVVRELEPAYEEYDRQLREAWRLIPAWLHPAPFGGGEAA
jgi:hypothetical protein